MVRLIHAADFHLDSPFSGLDPEQAIRRRAEQRELLGRLAELARDRNADLVLLAGDLFDAERVFQETAKALAQHLESIPCPVLIAPGATQFTRIWEGPSSLARALVRPITPALAAE